jgi:hypothetical protein
MVKWYTVLVLGIILGMGIAIIADYAGQLIKCPEEDSCGVDYNGDVWITYRISDK